MAAKSSAKKGKVTSLKPLKERAVSAALDLASRMGWDMITMTDIADKAHASLADLYDIFDDKTDILVAYGRMIDKKVLEAYAEPDPSMNERDRLFEIFMERFDILNDNREALVSILKSFITDPKQAVISLPHLGRSMSWMLEAAGIDTSGIKGAIKVTGLTIIYLDVLRAWVKDDTRDMAKTMAALDRDLNRAVQAANTFML